MADGYQRLLTTVPGDNIVPMAIMHNNSERISCRSETLPTERQVVAIVDDDPSVLKGLARILDASHFTTQIFNCAEAFLDRDLTSSIACIILDIHLSGMSGIEMQRRLTEMGSTTPVIFITSHDSASVRSEAMDAGCAAYLQKPFSGHVLIDAIRSAMSIA
jgi:FixJ family two-component response regulator